MFCGTLVRYWIELNIPPRDERLCTKIYLLWEALENDSEQLWRK